MIILPEEHDVIRQVLTKAFGDAEDRPQILDSDFSDYDGVRIAIHYAASEGTILRVSISSPCWEELQSFDVMSYLDEKYGQWKVEPAPNMNYTLQFDIATPPDNVEDVISSVARLKTTMYSAPFKNTIKKVVDGKADNSIVQLAYRPKEMIYLKAQSDGILIIFSLHFMDVTEAAIARVFCQEFQDAKNNHALSSCPPCRFDDSVPTDLEGVPGVTDKDMVGFVSFKLDPHHYAGNHEETVSARLQNFRTYLAYHIKATKAFLHFRMRRRGASWLQEWERND
ncbi:ARP2/3 complex, 34kDa subunit (p34-Arc) [Carpediemonas membranifera]|uniref:Arp2/3 complex 34 kDa subunit n=1 Tax=Carpediemonas membranifera TaxID=201153 RepID=A0A8J6E3H1_9EUKA|nr:ARP2/3 complex, 34kDa subunit (p34-Arc) [Carpediemonas membranifera]|eukprot:KAG9395606.1 ARP2/3 complex, 34kDa subunit (p34-Arc) [Carpediemonas membranifera]